MSSFQWSCSEFLNSQKGWWTNYSLYHNLNIIARYTHKRKFLFITMTSQWASWRPKTPKLCGLFNSLLRLTSKKTSKTALPALWEGNLPETGEVPLQICSRAESVSMAWCDVIHCPLLFSIVYKTFYFAITQLTYIDMKHGNFLTLASSQRQHGVTLSSMASRARQSLYNQHVSRCLFVMYRKISGLLYGLIPLKCKWAFNCIEMSVKFWLENSK